MTTRKETHRAGEHGQIVVFVAVSLVALLGIGALSIDAAYMYDQRNKLYAAADAAAKSAAFAHFKNPSSNLWAFGEHEVGTLLGLTPVNVCGSTSGTALCVQPPTQGPYAGNPNYVEAIVSRPSTASFFGRVLGWMSGSPGARAVAGTVNPANCVIIKRDLSMGTFTFVLNGCGVSVGGNAASTNPGGNAKIEDPSGAFTPPVNVVGGCSGDCSKMGDLNTGAAAPVDPLEGAIAAGTLVPLPPPANPATCSGTGTLTTIGPGCYNNISPAVTTLLPGDYYITGTVNIDRLRGDDVFLYLTNECGAPCGSHPDGGGFNVVGQNKLLHLTAHTSGPYQGIAVWQVVADTRPFSCLGCPPAGEPYPPNGFMLQWSGALYMPGVDQVYRNHAEFEALGCGLYITRSLTVENGQGPFNFANTNCAAAFGNAAFLSIAVVE